jgi:hypothetical protein
MSTEKHHYRNVFKSDHLSSADLEDLIEKKQRLIFTIKEVKQELQTKVAGKKIDANIAYFFEPIKPLVLNATNSKQLKLFSGSAFVEDWKGLTIELYIDQNVKFSGSITQGVRISPVQPDAREKQKPLFTEANFEKAKKANATKSQIEAVYHLPNETWLNYVNYGN